MSNPNLQVSAEVRALFPDVFKARPVDSHKGTFGSLGVIGGASGMSGAAVLAGTAAAYMGAGKVWVGFNQDSLPMPIIPGQPEILLATAKELMQRKDIDAWVIGCGFGLSDSSAELLRRILLLGIERAEHNVPMLLDADALTLLSLHEDLAALARQCPSIIITPHAAEAARLLHVSTELVAADRKTAVSALSDQYGGIAVLKGYQTLVADGAAVYQNNSGNPGLSTGGSGDVLSGIIGALLAQGISAWQATRAGVWLHGAAADYLRDLHGGEIGMLAGELPVAARAVRNAGVIRVKG
ncbi:NAD(P)H-hydrate dehydratase [Pelistega europaea]|uniref:ADP-dependent (S)-NAD(P)H-hydrate dehydratase n=1 Tax=Pelistega europaea TaxID=106147 RepID=A0A7Y4L862_9BURK|nr:NAD(P)H-hydrate dehydratase [Pelistega europaea]NOL48729.1 NAD(P)H-hydrate dehydratase [Pelistega europaea]